MRHALRLAPAVLLALSACAVDEEPAPDLEDTSLVMFNGIAPDVLVGSADALRALAAGPLNGASTPLADTADGRELLTDLARCALRKGGLLSPPETARFRDSNGRSFTFPGLVGLAPSWRNGTLNVNGQRLVTACLMAHVNATDRPFPISLRSTAIASPDLVEKLANPSQELVTYGNIFLPSGERELSVCFGEAVAKSLGGNGGLNQEVGLPNYLTFRYCGVDGGACNFNLVGGCVAFQPDVTQTACEQRPSTDFFKRCHDAPIQQQATASHDDTVTVNVNPADLTLMLGEYLDDVCQSLNVCLDLPDLPGLPL